MRTPKQRKAISEYKNKDKLPHLVWHDEIESYLDDLSLDDQIRRQNKEHKQ